MAGARSVVSLLSVMAMAAAGMAAPAAAADPAPAERRMTVEGPLLFTPAGKALYQENLEDVTAPRFTWQCTGEVTRMLGGGQGGLGPHPQIGFKLIKSCTDKFPPYIADQNAKPVGEFTIVPRPNGARQWAYRGKPLYTSVRDHRPGDINGAAGGFSGGFGRGGMSFATADVFLPVGFSLIRRPEGLVLVSTETRRAVYSPRNRARLQQTAMAREDFQPIAAPALARLNGEWSVVQDNSGFKQYAFRGKPLYAAAASLNDLEIRRATDWEPVVVVEAPPLPSVIQTRLALSGDVFATPSGMTLYTYSCNTGRFGGSRVTCDEAGDPAAYMVALCGNGQECADRWKPYFAEARARPVGEFTIVDITYPMFTDPRGELYPPDAPRAKVWAYRGKPLFTYYEDEKPGDIWGDGIGGLWGSMFVAAAVPGASAVSFEP